MSAPACEAPEGSWLLDRLLSWGNKPALTSGEPSTTLTASSLVALAKDIGEGLSASKVSPGERVLLEGDFTPAGVASLLALCRIGAVVVPIVPGAAEEERANRVEVSGAVWILETKGGSWSLKRVEHPVEAKDFGHPLWEGLRDCGHAGLVLFSSGSSGRPKGMVHDLTRLIASYRDRKPRSLGILGLLLFDHIGGLNTLFQALASGMHLVAARERSPEAVAEAIEHHRLHILPASPTFLNLLLLSGEAQRRDLRSLRIITYGAEPMPEALLERLRRTFPWARLLQTFGTSETGIVRTSSPDPSSTALRLDDPAVEWKIVEGELWLRSPNRILGYLNAPMEGFTADGWFRTGDQAEHQPDGSIRIAGRLREVINVGGEKVHPSEVESVLMEMPLVADCLVLGERNAITGSAVSATIQWLDKEASASEVRRAVRHHCLQRLAPYKVPVRVKLTASIPRGSRFKKQRLEEDSLP